MIGVILAAGNGTRLNNSTGEVSCKALRKVAGKHLIEFALDNLIKLNIDKVCIVVGQEGNLIKDTVGYGYRGLEISYVFQKQQKGLINALMQAIDFIGKNEDIVLQLADEILIGFKSENIKSAIYDNFIDFHCGVTYEEDAQKIKNNFSVEIYGDSIIQKCTEKPKVTVNNIKGTGFCVFKDSALDLLNNIYDEDKNTPNDLCDYMNKLIESGNKGKILVVAEKEFNINTAADLEEAKNFLEEDL